MSVVFDAVSYRDEVREWLDRNGDDAPRRTVLEPQDDAAVERRRAWQRRLADGGYVGVTWPRQFGGRGGLPAQRVVIERELDARGIAGPFDFVGLDMIGPTLLVCATPEQCERYLRPLLRADETWCQLLSEPGAGSDLAAVQTRARSQPDGTWTVDGQKVWTSFARHAAFGILLARTDPDVPKHKGLTMFAVPMDADGVTVRPLRQITGDAEFNEVFLDSVRLADAQRIGEVGDGWKVAVTMLRFERLAVGSGHLATPVEELAKAVSIAREDRDARVALGRIGSQLLALRYTSERLSEQIATGRAPGPEAGLVKISSVLCSLEACRLAVDVVGPDALLGHTWGDQISALPGVRSAGGTEEIIRNQIGERVLGLPAEPRP
ncbi:MAG TPA: acyl-CoA dehydrogenase family protein [Solirubrobacteraceae bacterium]|nr:acyl-CoA dehydrogenase family protein [Solirubrobacteraceae bacterium]